MKRKALLRGIERVPVPVKKIVCDGNQLFKMHLWVAVYHLIQNTIVHVKKTVNSPLCATHASCNTRTIVSSNVGRLTHVHLVVMLNNWLRLESAVDSFPSSLSSGFCDYLGLSCALGMCDPWRRLRERLCECLSLDRLGDQNHIGSRAVEVLILLHICGSSGWWTWVHHPSLLRDRNCGLATSASSLALSSRLRRAVKRILSLKLCGTWLSQQCGRYR